MRGLSGALCDVRKVKKRTSDVIDFKHCAHANRDSIIQNPRHGVMARVPRRAVGELGDPNIPWPPRYKAQVTYYIINNYNQSRREYSNIKTNLTKTGKRIQLPEARAGNLGIGRGKNIFGTTTSGNNFSRAENKTDDEITSLLPAMVCGGSYRLLKLV